MCLACFTRDTRTLLIILISQGNYCLCCKCYLTNHSAKDDVQMATSIGMMVQRFILYTLASLVVITLPQLQSMHMCELQTKHSSTYAGGANTTNLGLWHLSKIIYTW
jgi:hypothetical protein